MYSVPTNTNAKKLPPSRSPATFAPASVRSRKIDSGNRGDSARFSITTDPERLVALGALFEHVHDDRESGGQHDRGAHSLHGATSDQERFIGGQPARQ